MLAVLIRVLVRPFGPIPWAPAWILTAVTVVLGVDDWLPLRDLLRERAYLVWCFPLVALGAPFMDWWARTMQETFRRLERSGQVPAHKAWVMQGMFVASDGLIKFTPVLLMIAATVAGHFLGAAVAPNVPLGVALGGLIGSLAGGLLGGLLVMALLRAYRVEDGAPWPGQAGRSYPRLLAALYLAVTLGLFVLLLAR